jgi:hypothetical protein
MNKGTYIPISSLVKTSHKIIEDPQNDKKEIENFKTLKYQNKKTFEVSRRKSNTLSPPLVKHHMKKIKDPQNDKKSFFQLIFFHPQWGSFQVTFFSPLMGGSLQMILIYFSFQWGGHFKGFFTPKGFIF